MSGSGGAGSRLLCCSSSYLSLLCPSTIIINLNLTYWPFMTCHHALYDATNPSSGSVTISWTLSPSYVKTCYCYYSLSHPTTTLHPHSAYSPSVASHSLTASYSS